MAALTVNAMPKTGPMEAAVGPPDPNGVTTVEAEQAPCWRQADELSACGTVSGWLCTWFCVTLRELLVAVPFAAPAAVRRSPPTSGLVESRL
jgi:hypothetical protein